MRCVLTEYTSLKDPITPLRTFFSQFISPNIGFFGDESDPGLNSRYTVTCELLNNTGDDSPGYTMRRGGGE